MCRADGRRDLLGFRVLQEVAARTRLQGRRDLLFLDEARHRDDLDLGLCLLDGRDRPDPVQPWHQKVHQDDIRRQALRGLNAGHPVLGLADHLDVVEQIQERAEAASDDRVVVYQQDADQPSLLQSRLLTWEVASPRTVPRSLAKGLPDSE